MPTTTPIRVLVWGENRHEQTDERVQAIYPDGMHETIRGAIEEHLGERVITRTATLDEPEHGLTEEVLAATDVLLWWGHTAHDEVAEEVVDRVHAHVLAGMGLLVLHSGHWARVFQKLMGTTCSLRWRNDRDREVVWTVDPTHPIARGIPHPFVIPEQEMYGEFFDVPAPDELVFVSGFTGGEVFRSGMTYKRGHGRIFYFGPGDQEYPVYHQAEIRRILANGVEWAATDRAERAAPRLAMYERDEFDTPRHWTGELL